MLYVNCVWLSVVAAVVVVCVYMYAGWLVHWNYLCLCFFYVWIILDTLVLPQI